MKRIFVCLLVLMVCLSLCACGNDAAMEKYKEYEALIGYLESGDYESAYRELDRLTGKKDNGEEKAILGNWISTGAYEITFREDGTVEVYGAGRKIDGTWAYSSDLGCYTIATTQGNYSAFLKEEENITYVECFGAKLYGREVFETKMKPKLETARQEMEEKIASGVKIELGTEYTVGKAAVSLDLVLEEGDLWVYLGVRRHPKHRQRERDVPWSIRQKNKRRKGRLSHFRAKRKAPYFRLGVILSRHTKVIKPSTILTKVS